MSATKEVEKMMQISRDKCMATDSAAQAKNQFLEHMGTYVFRDIPEFMLYLNNIVNFIPQPDDRAINNEHLSRRGIAVFQNGTKALISSGVNKIQYGAYDYSYKHNPLRSFTPKKNDVSTWVSFKVINPLTCQTDSKNSLTFGILPKPFTVYENTPPKESWGEPQGFIVVVSTPENLSCGTKSYYLNNNHLAYLNTEWARHKQKEAYLARNTMFINRNIVDNGKSMAAPNEHFFICEYDFFRPVPRQDDPLLVISNFLENAETLTRSSNDYIKLNSFKEIVDPKDIGGIENVYKMMVQRLSGVLLPPTATDAMPMISEEDYKKTQMKAKNRNNMEL